MTNAIQIIEGSAGWMAKFTGPHSAEVFKLFRTCVIPTAFGSSAPRSVVLAEVQKLNPNALVFHKVRSDK